MSNIKSNHYVQVQVIPNQYGLLLECPLPNLALICYIQIQAYSSKFMPIHAAWANVGFDLKNRFPVPKNIYFDI